MLLYAIRGDVGGSKRSWSEAFSLLKTGEVFRYKGNCHYSCNRNCKVVVIVYGPYLPS